MTLINVSVLRICKIFWHLFAISPWKKVHFFFTCGSKSKNPFRKSLNFLSNRHSQLNLEKAWETPTEFIWQYSMVRGCDVYSVHKNPFYHFRCVEYQYYKSEDYQKVKPGDVVWVRQDMVPRFCRLNLPRIQVPFVLVISGNIRSFPREVCRGVFSFIRAQQAELLLNHPHIIHIFAQNLDYQYGNQKKVSHMPVGIDYHTIAYKNNNPGRRAEVSPLKQEAELKNLLARLKPTHQRKFGAFIDFHHTNSYKRGRFTYFQETRADIFKILAETGLISFSEKKMIRSQLWATKGDYAFSVSPPGNGLDCHRTWEDLILGCIVIVKTGPLDPLYQGLPVVIVNDWREITPKNMKQWLIQYQDAFTNHSYREKLTSAYWIKQFRSYAGR